MDFIDDFLYTYNSEIYDQDDISGIDDDYSLYILQNEINSDQDYYKLLSYESGDALSINKKCKELEQIGYYIIKVYIYI